VPPGENSGHQGRPGRLVRDPWPAGRLAAGQLLLLDRVHRPRLVGLAAAGGAGRQEAAQLDEDPAGPPGRAFVAQPPGKGVPAARGAPGLAAGGVARGDGRVSEAGAAPRQACRGGRRRAWGAGDGRRPPFRIGEAKDGAAHLRRLRGRHRGLLVNRAGPPYLTATDAIANSVSPFR
jgi:hypothetical protein